jgi:hypothetical protein
LEAFPVRSAVGIDDNDNFRLHRFQMRPCEFQGKAFAYFAIVASLYHPCACLPRDIGGIVSAVVRDHKHVRNPLGTAYQSRESGGNAKRFIVRWDDYYGGRGCWLCGMRR